MKNLKKKPVEFTRKKILPQEFCLKHSYVLSIISLRRQMPDSNRTCCVTAGVASDDQKSIEMYVIHVCIFLNSVSRKNKE